MPSSLPSLTGNPTSTPVLPEELLPRSDFRCGITELDARGNCHQECSKDISICGEGEECWPTFTNYCHIKPEGHPECDDLEKGDEVIRRCGFEEIDARGYCGKGCLNSAECNKDEYCYPVQRNFCQCFDEQDKEAATPTRRRAQEAPQTNAEYFEEARKIIEPFFLKATSTDPPATTSTDPPVAAPVDPPTSTGSSIGQRTSLVVGVVFAGVVFAF
jgi:hypothetical protein